MRNVSTDNFGLLIAYLLPGFVALWGIRTFVPGVETWMAVDPVSAPTVGGFLYVTLGSTAAGLIVSAVRWAVLDHLHHATGLPQPRWDFRQFPANVAAFDSLVESHYRYYQFYANMLVALFFAVAAEGAHTGQLPLQGSWGHVGIGLVGIILFSGSRDALRKYYERTAAVLSGSPPAAKLPARQRLRSATGSQPRPRLPVALRSPLPPTLSSTH